MSFSDFPGESERLFIGGFQRLEICGLSVMGESMKYDEYIRAIKIMQNGLIKGMPSSSRVRARDAEIIEELIENVLNEEADNKEEDENEDDTHSIPPYIVHLFENMLRKQRRVCIDIGRISKESLWVCPVKGPQFGYKLLYSMYFTADNRIRWNVLQRLYPSLTTIYIRNQEKIKNELNGYKFSHSLEISEDLLRTILVPLSQKSSSWRWIDIINPSNSKQSLSALISAHQSSFNQHGFALKVETHHHPQCPACDALYINPM